MRFQNPILPGFHPDPSICRVGNDYYLVTSTFEYFPGVPVFHSRDLVHWRQLGHCLTRPSQLPLAGTECSMGIWAPTLRYHHGRFYMVTTNMGHGGNFLVTAEDPAGEWSEPLWFDPDGWDPSLFFDDDGTAYLSRNGTVDGSYGIIQYALDVRSGRPLESPRLAWRGSGGFGPEAPHLYRIGGYYYLMLAEGGTHAGHQITIARSTHPHGPFEPCPHNPILTHRDHLDSPVQATGHGDLVQLPDGSWWMVFLGIRNFGTLCHMLHHLGRETFLAPVSWRNGWPIVNDAQPVPLEMDAPALAAHPFPAEPCRDDFDGDVLRPCWNFLRDGSAANWSLSQRRGWLALHGTACTLNDAAAPAFVGRRQQHPRCIARCLLDFVPHTESEEAGLTLLMSREYHYDLAIRRAGGGRVLLLRRRVGDLEVVAASVPLPSGNIVLEVRAEPQWYELFYGTPGGPMTLLARARTKFLATEVAGTFTGVYFGLYATGNGLSSTAPAFVDWFDYEPLD